MFWRFSTGLSHSIRRFCLGVFCILLIQSFWNDSTQANIPPQRETKENPKEFYLSEVLKESLTGLSLESEKQQQVLKENAHWYARQRADWKYSGVSQKVLQNCKQDPSKKPFCLSLAELNKRENENPHRSRSILTLLKNFKTHLDAHTWVQTGNIQKLSALPSYEIKRSLKKISTLESLKPLITHSLDSPACDYAPVKYQLASRMEGFFPEPEAQKEAMSLYEKVAQCPSAEASLRSQYRLSLLYLWKDQCKEALPFLKSLSSQTENNDFQSRALFWQISCLDKEGSKTPENLKALEKAKQTLLTQFPFSFHTLLMQMDKKTPSGTLSQDLPVSLQEDSVVLFRTSKSSELNEEIRAVEALLGIKEQKLARELLEKLRGPLAKTEPEFRLYVGTLLYRANSYNRNFHLLSSIFRDKPTLISKPALELYYPRDVLPGYDLSRGQVDGKLLLSLIRQESGFNAKAKSSAGALGLMQIMPGTARRFERSRHSERLFDPSFNLKIGSRYFSDLLEKYSGDAELALAAYNAGPKKVDLWLNTYPVKDRILFLDLIPYKETRDYVACIARNYYWYSHLYPELQPMAQNKTRLGSVFHLLGHRGPNREIATP